MTIPKKIISFLWAILAAYATTAIVLFLLAFIMFKFDLDESVAQFAVTFVYILSAAVGALVLGQAAVSASIVSPILINLFL